jgi:transcriptional regulator with XRE-family HTH domain
MEVGRKLRELRQARHLSQGDIEKKVGLLRCYTSRIENGMTIPSIETLEKFAYALDIPLYRFFTNGEAVRAPKLPTTNSKSGWGTDDKNRRELRRFAEAFKRMDNRKQKLLVHLAEKMAIRHTTN